MQILVHVIGIILVVSGVFLVIFTERTRELYKRAFLIENVKKLSFLPLVLGVILILGAFRREPFLWLPLLVGLVGLGKGVYLLVVSPDKSKGLMEWWFYKASPETVRLFALISFVLGMGLLR